jgi:coenzyme F420-dependent glucose-6-phosphate dehydrogenase
MRIGYHASHEQFPPSQLLAWAQRAEAGGFDSLFSSDHFHPWSEKQGQAGFSFAYMGAALARTALAGRMICCPGGRYHPAVVAQAAATLAEMFPGRFWIALGSGQALNERVTGEIWPTKDVRNARLQECAEIIRALWAGETVTHRGLVRVEEAKLYTRPEKPPLLIGAAVSEQTAEWMGSWADGLLTTSRPKADAIKIAEAFRRGGGAGKPMFLKVGLSWAFTDSAARQNAFDQWRNPSFSNAVLTELRTPAEFDEVARHVRPCDLDQGLRISGDLERHLAWLQDDLEVGFQEIYLHNVGLNQEAFIDEFGEKVLPRSRGRETLET